MNYQFLGNIVTKGHIEVLTGLHIGGSKEKLEIGGVDSPVLRDPNTNFPYIPASSIKGKMRMLLEFAQGKISVDGKTHSSSDINDEICRIFGNFEKGTEGGPTRLIIRDAYPNSGTVEMWKKLDSELLFTELKPENTINRITSEANPRFLERVVKGSKFDCEFVYSIYDTGDNGKSDMENFKYVVQALRLLEHSGLGGSVSRGYGQIKFHLTDPVIVRRDDYINATKNYIETTSMENDNSKNLKTTEELTLPTQTLLEKA